MSADTSIAIAKFTDWRRHTGVIQAIENMDREWYGSNEEWCESISEYDWSKPFIDEPSCYKHASHYMDDYCQSDGYPLEYWIVYVWEFPFSINQPIDEPTTLWTN